MRPMPRLAVVSACLAVAALLVSSSPAVAGGLPLLADRVEADRLPLPFGAGITVYDQRQDYRIERLAFNVPLVIDPAAVAIDNSFTEINVKLDVWLFPFLNLFAVIGDLEGETVVDLSRLALPVPIERITVDLDGDVLGGGLTLAYGGERWFGSLTGVFTETDLSGTLDSSADTLVVMPRFGVHGGAASFWVGAMYQQATEDHRGQIALPVFGLVDFSVELAEDDEWNALVGMEASLGEHFHLEVEGGFGSRISTSIGASYRF